MSKLTVVILTFIEAIQIKRAVRSIKSVADRVFIVDGGSTDDMHDLAEAIRAVLGYQITGPR